MSAPAALPRLAASPVCAHRPRRLTLPALLPAAFPPWASKYTCMKLLSQGGYGNVWLVRTDGGTMLVFKEILSPGQGDRVTPRSADSIPLEATLLSAHQHPFIVRLTEVIYDQPSGGLGLVTEFCDRGDLHTLLAEMRRRGESVPEPQLLTWLVQICSALAHLHRQRVLHRDVKTANIFVSADGTLKLGDFGLARTIGTQQDAVQSRVGSPFYLSPEICQNQVCAKRTPPRRAAPPQPTLRLTAAVVRHPPRAAVRHRIRRVEPRLRALRDGLSLEGAAE